MKIQHALKALASMKMSVVLLCLGMVLIYAGTWAQIDAGIYQVQQRYFHTWLAKVPLGVMLPRAADGGMAIPGSFYMPGGYLVGLLMLINLLANWVTRFKLQWRHGGIHLIHVSLVLLLAGEAWSSLTQIDSRMMLTEGQTSSYTEDFRRLELALIDRSDPAHDRVIAIGHDLLKSGSRIAKPSLPVELVIDQFASNAELVRPAAGGPQALATAGEGIDAAILPKQSAGVVSNESDTPAAYVSVLENGQDRGRYLLSTRMPFAQKVILSGGKEFALQLRHKQYHKPYSITLLDFRHDKYAGTDMPRNFSSRVRLVDTELCIDREELIWMNHPLRHRGETFYQASFVGEDTTVFQVVRNPAVVVPYIACVIGAIGLVLQLFMGLQKFFDRRAASATIAAKKSKSTALPATSGGWELAVPLTLGLICGIFVIVQMVRSYTAEPIELAQAPVYFNGRLQPLDSVARNTLRAINGRATVTQEAGEKLSAQQWLMEVICRPEQAADHRIFLIENPEVLAILKLDSKRKRFSPAEIQGSFDELRRQAGQAMERPGNQRDLVQRKILELWQKVQLFSQVADISALYVLPPQAAGGDWRPLSDELAKARNNNNLTPDPLAQAISRTVMEYHRGGTNSASQGATDWIAQLRQQRPGDMRKMQLEVFYNRWDPFLVAMGLYVLVLLLGCGSMLAFRVPLWRSAMTLAVIALVVHTIAIAARMYLQGRPPVTNLYSSAIFIGWGAVLLAVFVELFYRNALALSAASLVGSATLIVAQNLAQGGDTMPSMQAVLDSNFWLTTHVLAITYGYSAVFLAGALGIAFVIAGIFAAKSFTPERRAAIGRMIFAVAAFAMLFSFVGTLLGGIWADQSWGRFWGWDPKENGACLIVLWLAVMLHVRWIGVREKGLALLAIFGNIVTAWSWFGTNMLGVGLHSYGFMDSALMWLLLFVGSQLALILVGFFAVSPGNGASALLRESGTGASGQMADASA